MATGAHKLVTTTVPRYNWVPDAERKKCVNQHCGSKFTPANRRHHCRFCGDIFCAKCLIKRGGHNCCAGCKEKTEGKVILVESKKERKAKAAMALKDFQSKLSAERSKHSSSGVSSTTTSASSSPAKPAAPSPEVAAASAKPAPASPQKKKVSRVQVTAEVHAEAHTATFSTAPAPKRENSRDKLSSSRESASPRLSQAPLDDPFATGGDADNAHSDEEGDGDGDISGDITNQHIEDTSSEDEPPDEDDFAAMLAAADDLQAS